MGKIATEQEAYNIGKTGILRIDEPCTKARARELGCAIKPGYSYAGNEPVELEALYKNTRAGLAWNTTKYYYTHSIEKASDPLEIKVSRVELIQTVFVGKGFFAGECVDIYGDSYFSKKDFSLDGMVWKSAIFEKLTGDHYSTGQQYEPGTDDLWEFDGSYYDSEEERDYGYVNAKFRLPDVTIPGSEFDWSYVFRYVIHISTNSWNESVSVSPYILYNRYRSYEQLPSPTDYYWRPLSGLAGLEFTECEDPKPDFFD